MEIIKLTHVTINGIAKIIANNINRGKLVIIPVETAYALSANALDKNAIEKVYEVKKRENKYPMHICVNSIKMAANYAEISPVQEYLLKHFLPGPITFILNKKPIIPDKLTANLKTIGIRIPNTSFITMLSNYIEVPFTLTSANISGMPTCFSVKDIIAQFGEEYLNKHIATIVESDEKLLGNVSTIVDITNENNPAVIREGIVDKKTIIEEIEQLLKRF